jgi:hypothetical protein
VTQRRCQHLNCGTWHDIREAGCPSCGAPRGTYNKWLVTAKLNDNLYAGARAHDQEMRDYKARAVGAIKAPKWAQERAARILDTA